MADQSNRREPSREGSVDLVPDLAEATSPPLCPSAQPEMQEAVAFGVVGGSVTHPLLGYLAATQQVTEQLLRLSDPVAPTEIFRFAARCAGPACQHFDGRDCQLAKRIVEVLPLAVTQLPPCPVRPRCRWWQQEGRQACLRCPQVVTETYGPSDEVSRVATAVR